MKTISAFFLAAAAAALATPATAAPIYTYLFRSAPFVPEDSDFYDPDPASPITVTLVIDEALVPGGTLKGATLAASYDDDREPLPSYLLAGTTYGPDILGGFFDVSFDGDRQVTAFEFDSFGDPESYNFAETGAVSVFFDDPGFTSTTSLATDGPSTVTLVSVAPIPLPATAGLLLLGVLPFAGAAAAHARARIAPNRARLSRGGAPSARAAAPVPNGGRAGSADPTGSSDRRASGVSPPAPSSRPARAGGPSRPRARARSRARKGRGPRRARS